MVKKNLTTDPYSFEPTASSVFTWGFVLDPLGILLFVFWVLQALFLEVWKCFSQETSLYLVEPCRMVGVPGEGRPHLEREEQVGRCNMGFMESVKTAEAERAGDRKGIKVIMGYAK